MLFYQFPSLYALSAFLNRVKREGTGWSFCYIWWKPRFYCLLYWPQLLWMCVCVCVCKCSERCLCIVYVYLKQRTTIKQTTQLVKLTSSASIIVNMHTPIYIYTHIVAPPHIFMLFWFFLEFNDYSCAQVTISLLHVTQSFVYSLNTCFVCPRNEYRTY